MSILADTAAAMSQSSRLRMIPQPALKIGKSELTRAAIMNAALDFIWSHPFRDMTVSSLMAPTGVSRAAFYPHFSNLHELMETLLDILRDEIFATTQPYFDGVGDPVALLGESLTGLVRVCHQQGPFLRAVSDAAAADKRLEEAWMQFLEGFDDAVTNRIEADHAEGLTPVFDARPVACALNRLDAYALIHAFGTHPRGKREPVRKALARIWISTLYGSEWLGKESSDLLRK